MWKSSRKIFSRHTDSNREEIVLSSGECITATRVVQKLFHAGMRRNALWDAAFRATAWAHAVRQFFFCSAFKIYASRKFVRARAAIVAMIPRRISHERQIFKSKNLGGARHTSSPSRNVCSLPGTLPMRTEGPSVCPPEGRSFILSVCLEAIDRIRSSYFSCLSALSNRTGVSARRSTDSGHV